MRFFSIEDRAIGPDEPTLVIAEIGVNHDGSLQRAEQLVQHARAAAADVVKLQIFKADQLLHPSAGLAEYQRDSCSDDDAAALLRRYELRPLEIARLVEMIRQLGMIPLATPFSIEDVELIEHLYLPAIKIASPDLVNPLLLKRCAQLRRPMLVSTGAATMDEVERCVTWLSEWQLPFALMHCVSAYPAPTEQTNLRWISELGQRFDVPVGFSDHTTELLGGALAVSAGACIVEKHLTWDKSACGPDHAASSDPREFAEYARLVRLAERMRGNGGKCVLQIEHEVRTVSRQSLVVVRDVEAGQMIAEHDLIAQRPGTGICVADASRAIGCRARHRIRCGTLLQWDMLSDAA